MKKIMPTLGAVLVLITIILSRLLFFKYGETSRVIIITIALIVSSIGMIGIIFTKKYLAILVTFTMFLPLVVMAIGIYIDNMYITALGLLLIFILIPIMIKIIKK